MNSDTETSTSPSPDQPANTPPVTDQPANASPGVPETVRVPPAPTPAFVPGKNAPPRPGGPRPGGASRPFPQGHKPFPKGEKPQNPGGSPPQLRDFVALKPNNRELDAMIEDELNQAMAGFNVESTVAEAETMQKPVAAGATTGQRKKGRVIAIHGKDVFIEVPGGRSQGVLPLEQFEGVSPKIGTEVEFEIERYDGANGLLVLTREGSAQTVTDWSSVALHMIVEARVTGTNKNKTGLTIEVNGIKGFLPASQLDLYRVEDLDQFLNQRLKVQVVELDPQERNLIVSRRALLERERAAKAEQFWATLQEGQVLKGIVKSIKPFGAFVDLGGADGLIPVSEFSWQRVSDLNEFVKLGQQVEVVVARLDREARKIGLSVKQLTTSPWDEFATRVKPGARISGKVTRTTDFGAFVELEPGIEGLIHVSELSTQHVRRVRDIIQVEQMVEVEVLSVDPASRRIGLSLKTISREKEVAAESASVAEREEDLKAAEEKMANRPVNPNLRGGIGANQFKYEQPE
jgi:small subunit ribosomal protein S1